jgi:hypothetical protein
VAPAGVGSRASLACVVARGASVAGLSGAVDRLAPTLRGTAVVLTRLSPPTPASSAVVHAVVDLLHDRGCDEVVVAGRLTVADRDRGHRRFGDLVAGAGLLGVTTRGRGYAVADLDADLADAPVAPESVLHGRPCSLTWATADCRVVVGRAVTDLVDGYAASLATLLTAVPEVAGAEAADVCVDLLAHIPVDLVVVDALEPSVGADGARLRRVIRDESLVVATDPVLADTATAALLGQDRSASRLVARAVERLDASTGGTVGDLRPVTGSGVSSPSPRLRAAARALCAEPRLERVLHAAVGPTGDDQPDQGDPVLAALRAVLTPLVEGAGDAAGEVALEGILALVHGLAHSRQSWATNLDKDAVDRREVPLGFDPAAYPHDAYAWLPDFLAPFEDLVRDLPANQDGMRWRLVDGATVFAIEREVRADFDAWVARVDVGAGISLMADYLGGRRVPVDGAPDPDVTWQAERNLYLPQPNYLAPWGAHPIDVCKIEQVERRADLHRLTWRTVHSPNGSATFDDGSLTFARAPAGVRVTVTGRQQFSLPPAWAGVDLGLWPEVRDPLLAEAYRRFFTSTFDNLEACFEGREFRIGRPPPDPDEPLLTASVSLLLAAAQEWLAERSGTSATQDGDSLLDADGFTHVRGAR